MITLQFSIQHPGEDTNRRAGELLRDMRKARSVTQRDMAKLLDMGQANVSRLETGRVPVTADIIDRYARLLYFTVTLTVTNLENHHGS